MDIQNCNEFSLAAGERGYVALVPIEFRVNVRSLLFALSVQSQSQFQSFPRLRRPGHPCINALSLTPHLTLARAGTEGLQGNKESAFLYLDLLLDSTGSAPGFL